MTNQFSPTPPLESVEPLRVLEDLESLERAMLDPAGPERVVVNELVRGRGVVAIASQALRHNAGVVLERHGATLSEASRVLLQRLSIAGYQQPAHWEYTAVSVLCRTDDAIQQAPPETIARVALRTVADIVGMLEQLPQLENHPDRIRLRKNIAATRALCGSLAFAPACTDGHEIEEFEEDRVAHGAMLPESGIPDEKLFQSVTQASEVLFAAARILAGRAAVHIAHDQAVLAATDLHYAAIVERPLINLLGLLVSMEVPTWLEIRDYIERPAAIQSENYRQLRKAFAELERIGGHPRFPEHEQARHHWFSEALREAMELFDRWKSMHLAIALKYTPGGSPGATWLKTQATPLAEKRRLKKTGSSQKPVGGGCPVDHGQPSANPTAPAPMAGGCPMGFGSKVADPGRPQPPMGSGPIGY